MSVSKIQEPVLFNGQVKPTHFLSSSDFTADQFRTVLDHAKALKHQWKNDPQTVHHVENRLMAMIFEKQSLRTRVSFETAFHELGGHASYLTKNDIEMGKRESIADTARVLSQWCTLIVARLNRHKDILELAKHATSPVINALTDKEHPCQALADLQTIEESFGAEKVKVTWVGDGNNVANSFAITAARLGHEVVVCTPPGYECDEAVYQHANVTHQYQPAKAVEGAQVVYTDVWVSMGQETEAVERMNRFAKYQVDGTLMGAAAPNAIFLHCLPAVRGLEVASEVIDGPQSRVFDQSENRMHAQKALMKLIIEGKI